MPHSGELLAYLGTLRGEGAVVKRDNALYVDTTIEVGALLMETGDDILAETGDYLQTE